MLKILKTWAAENPRPKLSSCGALLEYVEDDELRDALLAALVNTLRRTAPYAYFFAGGFTPVEFFAHFSGGVPPFFGSLERKKLQRMVSFTYPDFNYAAAETAATVFAIGDGDVLGAVPWLNDERFSLLCLPLPASLDWIAETITQSANNLEALQAMLSGGGFLVSIIDDIVFKLQTYDSQYGQYFPHRSSQSLLPRG